MKIKIILSAMLSMVVTWLHAQQIAATAGGRATGSGGKVSYTLGQVSYTFSTGTTDNIAEGVQQPYEVFTLTDVEQVNINLHIEAFPNPTLQTLLLTCSDNAPVTLSYQLHDITGKAVVTGHLLQKQIAIDMSSLSSGNYMLHVLNNSHAVKSFKIIKN